jgi:UDP-glucose 4-epimerase
VAALRARGDEVLVVDRRPHPDPSQPVVIGDLRDPGVVEAALSPGTDAVVHLAAITSVLQSKNDPDSCFRTNVLATHYLLERCREIECARVVFASSNAVVGDVGRAEIHEEMALRPLTPYGATKAAAEMLLSAYGASYGLIPVALRFSNIYGAGMQDKDSVVARLMRAALSGTGIDIYGDGEQLRDYVYVSDACAAIELGLARSAPAVLAIGSGHSVSMNEMHRLACAATGVEIPARHIDAKAGEMPAVRINLSAATAAGFQPRYDLGEGLAETWASFQESAGR